jgi:RNA polymerase sigma factor (sigma-70 family)
VPTAVHSGSRGGGRRRGVESLVDPSVARSRAAVSLLDAHATALRRSARRVSICPDDADEALQRATLILLTKAPPHPPARLAGWMHVVTRREALALRRERERLLGAEVGDVHASAPCPAERAERREDSRRRARLLARLKPDQRRALVLKGQGYSYREICELTGWTYTKVNRCLAEGRARLRQLGALG